MQIVPPLPALSLSVTDLGLSRGGLDIVSDLSLSAGPGEAVLIHGPNGAGKTTTFNLVSGLLQPTAGSIRLNGTDLAGKLPDVRCHLGLGRAFQVVQPFPEMTVAENVNVGALFGQPGTTAVEAEALTRDALMTSGLWHLRDTPAEDLTLMQEKRLEIARALATRPLILLLDEVMAGLRPGEAREAIDLVRRIRDTGVTVIFIEHVMPVVKDLADRVIVMDYGRMIAEGSYAEVTANPAVIEAYLGTDEEGEDAL